MLHTPNLPEGEAISASLVERKFGLKEDMRAIVIAAPDTFDVEFVGDLAPTINDLPPEGAFDFVHLFVRRLEGLEDKLDVLAPRLSEGGMLWVSFPNWSSPLFVDVTEDMVRAAALPFGLVDIKARAVDDDWCGLKLIQRRPAETPKRK